MSVTVSAIGAENVPESWLDAVNARMNDLYHADMCRCDGWPEACENYKPGDWDASPTALLVAAVVLEPLIREQVADAIRGLKARYYFNGTGEWSALSHAQDIARGTKIGLRKVAPDAGL